MRWVEVSTQAQLNALKPGEGAIVRSGYFTASGSSTVTAFDSSTVTASDSSTVTAFDSSTVRAFGSSTVRAFDSSTVTASGSSTVTAFDSSTVTASGSSTVRAFGSSTVTAYDSSTVRASKFVAVHHLSERSTVKGGVIIKPKTDTPADWCDFYGVEVKRGMAVLFKAVEDDWRGGRKHAAITYRPGDKPSAPDWDPHDGCGNGLHLSPRPFMARTYCASASHFVACKVRVSDMVLIGDKVKVKTCTVLHEVDEDGIPIEVAS